MKKKMRVVGNRTNSEKVLKASEEKYRSLFEESRDAIVITTRRGEFIDANAAASELFGYTREEILKMNFRKLYVDPYGAYKFQQEMKEKGSVQGFKTKLRGKGHVEMDCVLSVVCQRGDDGSILEYQGFIRDVSEAKRAQEELKTSQQRLSQIINFLPDATVVIDLEGKVIAWNRAIENMTGIKAQEMLGKGNYEYAIPFYGERRPVLIDIVGQWNKEIEKKYQYIKKEGESLIAETRDSLIKPGGLLWNKASLLYDHNGEVIGAIESIRDITDRKVAEEALRASEAKVRKLYAESSRAAEMYRSVLHTSADAIVTYDMEGKVAYANPSFTKIFGWTLEEVEGKRLQFVPESEKKASMAGIKRIVEEGKPIQGFETKRYMRDGRLIDVSISGSRYNDHEGNPMGMLALIRDISENKKLANQLQQAQKMEAIATLAGGVAHEFNNALMGIMGNIELLKMDLPKDERRDKYFETMKSSGHRMSRLIDQLLAYAQGGKYQPRDLRLDDFVIETLPILQHDLSPEIRVETHFPKDIAHIKADYAQMQMVLSAILANSNEAIEDEGLIRITAENKDIDEDFTKQHPGIKPGLYVCLTIEDDGKGMDEETRSGIFEPFFTTKFQGRGMGMAAVYGIVKNHDGSIYVTSELGRGTAVRIYLPPIEIDVRKPKEAEVGVAAGTGTILMIEDEDVVIDVTRAMLERLGYRVLVAKTGKDAIQITETFGGQIDLALLDIKLPDIEGGKVYPLIMKARPNLKVIVFSGYAIEGPARKILDAGAQNFIQKPFSLITLSEKLKEVLEGEPNQNNGLESRPQF